MLRSRLGMQISGKHHPVLNPIPDRFEKADLLAPSVWAFVGSTR